MLKVLRLSLCFLILCHMNVWASDLPIQSFKTPSGLDVWFVEDHASPMVSLKLTFNKEKISSPLAPAPMLLRTAMKEGSGVLSPSELHRFIKEIPIESGFHFGVSENIWDLETTNQGLKPCLEYVAKLVKKPDFQKADFKYLKSQLRDDISDLRENMGTIAAFTLIGAIFPELRINIDFKSILSRIVDVKTADLEMAVAREFLWQKPLITVVGDVTKAELIKLLDTTIGSLPFEETKIKSSSLKPRWKKEILFVKKEIPQSTVAFAHPGISPQSKDFPKYLLLQNVLQDRFYDEMRSKRGLVYDVGFSAHRYKDVNFIVGQFSSEGSQAPRLVKFVQSEWERIKDFGITQVELTSAKRAFKQNNILSLTSSSAVASVYADFQDLDLGPKIAQTLLESTEQVTLKEMNNFVAHLLNPEELPFVIVGSKGPEEKK